MHPAIADKREELAALCRRQGVAWLKVFGSAAPSTDFGPLSSDADFLVAFRPDGGRASLRQYFDFDFAEAWRRALGRRVDLVEPGAIGDPYLRTAIDQSRELVYAS